MNNAFSIVYARQGMLELRELIELRSVGALPIGGRYRVIDILLSNLTNSGVRSVGIITQRNYKSLIDHVGSGKEWNLSKKVGGLRILPPYDLATSSELYRGILDALLDKRDFIDHQKWKYCLLMSTDKVYRQDFNALMDRHVSTGADITVICSPNAKLMADESGFTTYFDVDENGRVKELTMEPTESPGCRANLGACIMDKELLVQLAEDACAKGLYNFDTDVLMGATKNLHVESFEHQGYVGCVSSVKSYFEMNKDMLDKGVRQDLFDPEFPVYTKTMDAPPTQFLHGCEVSHSLFGNGCQIAGSVKDSIVFRGVIVEQGAHVENCIIMQGTKISKGAKVCNMIVDKDVTIMPNSRCISAPYDPKVIRKGVVIDGDAW